MSLWSRLRRRPSRRAAILRVLLEAGGPVWGLELAKRAGVPIGAHHAVLVKLAHFGLVESDWLPGPYPRRRVYWLTDAGRLVARRETAKAGQQ